MPKFQIEDHYRLTSGVAKLYLALKDGKKHSISDMRKMLQKGGLKRKIFGHVYALGRLLREHNAQDVYIEKTGWSGDFVVGTLQIAAFTKTRTPSKQATKKAQKKVKRTVKPAPKATKEVEVTA